MTSAEKRLLIYRKETAMNISCTSNIRCCILIYQVEFEELWKPSRKLAACIRYWKLPLWTVSKGSFSNDVSLWIHVSALNSHLCTEFLNEMNSRKKTSLCFQHFMSSFYQINVAVSRPTEFNLEQNLHTSGKFCVQCRIKFQLQCSSIFTGWKYLYRIFSLSSRDRFCGRSK